MIVYVCCEFLTGDHEGYHLNRWSYSTPPLRERGKFKATRITVHISQNLCKFEIGFATIKLESIQHVCHKISINAIEYSELRLRRFDLPI